MDGISFICMLVMLSTPGAFFQFSLVFLFGFLLPFVFFTRSANYYVECILTCFFSSVRHSGLR